MSNGEQFIDDVSLSRADWEGMLDRRFTLGQSESKVVSALQLAVADDEGMYDRRVERQYVSAVLSDGESVSLISS